MISGKLYKQPTININLLLLLCSIAFTIFYNEAFFSNVLAVYPFEQNNILFLLSLGIIISALNYFVLGLISSRYTTKTLLIILFPCTALANYFMTSYNIVIDTTMIQNTLATDLHESADLFSMRLLMHLFFWGILPAIIIYRLKLKRQSFKSAVITRAALLSSSLIVSVLLIAVSSEHFATFFREHKILRYYANPLTYIYSGSIYVNEQINSPAFAEIQPIGQDAKIPEWDKGRELIILVVGETARADRFSLNGYERTTNPLLEKQELTSFSQVRSCATTTAISVPCMFSMTDTSEFKLEYADNFENLLDVLDHAEVATLWRDNNSDSKGVAQLEIFEDFRNPEINPVCDIECRDIGMLSGLDKFIADQEAQDIVIILHQMGNHGPAYSKRYPKEFEIFTPVCETNELEQCSIEEINNAYDNAILYTDYFLSEVIELLKNYDDSFETAMLYMSDHGESLGEFSLYLHGLPNFLAPDEQREIPAIIWLGKNYEVSNEELLPKKNLPFDHDNFFHTVLGLMEIQTAVYNPDMDIVHSHI